MKKLVVFLFTFVLMTYSYAGKPETPQWHWSVINSSSSTKTLSIKATIWSGYRATYYNVYAGSIKVVSNKSTGATENSILTALQDQVIDDTADLSVLAEGTYHFTIEACNQYGCRTSSARMASIGVENYNTQSGTTVQEDEAQKATQSGVSDKQETIGGTSGANSTTLVRPDLPTIDTLSSVYSDNFTIKWNMWWGNKGNKIQLYFDSILIETKTLDSYNTKKGKGQKGMFYIDLEALKSKDILSGSHIVFVKLCYNSLCRTSPSKSIKIQAHSESFHVPVSLVPGAAIPKFAVTKDKDESKLKEKESKAQNTEADRLKEKAKEKAKNDKEAKDKEEKYQQSLKESGNVERILPSAPSLSWLPQRATKGFNLVLHKWWGVPGEMWKLEHINKMTNVKTLYELGKADISESEPNSAQSKDVRIDFKFIKFDKKSTSVASRAIGSTIFIETSENKAVEHVFTPIFCNNSGCTRAEFSKTVIISKIADEAVSSAILEDEKDKELSTGKYPGLKMNRSTWTKDEKKLGRSLAALNTKLFPPTSKYIKPVPKKCPNIDTNGKINNKEALVYFAGWSVYDREHYPRDLDGCNLTGVLFAFGYPGPNGRLYVGDGWANVQIKISQKATTPSSRYSEDPELGYFGIFNQFVQFKKEYPHIKVYLSLGGWTWSTYFSAMSKYPETRAAFIEDAIEMLRTFQLDGIDIDWEFPKSAEDRANYAILLEEFRAALDDAVKNKKEGFLFSSNKAAKTSIYTPKNNKFTLSIAISPDNIKTIQYYDLAKINNTVDFVIYMAYDYAGAWSKQTGHQAPLHNSAINDEVSQKFNIESGVEAYTQGEKSTTNPNGFNETGIDSEKLILGLPYYARGWNTDSSKVYQVASPGTAATGTWEKGVADYKKLKNSINSHKSQWNLIWDKDAKASMAYGAYKGRKALWTYDDERAICEKINFVKANNLGGAFAWESSSDDGSLQSIAVSTLKDSNNCSDLYPDSLYDTIFENEIGEYEGIKEEATVNAPTGISGEVTKDDSLPSRKQNENSTALPSDEELKQQGEYLFISLSEQEKEAIKHLTNQLEFDASTLVVSRSLSRDTNNVSMVKSVISKSVYNQLFPIQNKIYNYDTFIRAVKAFPKLCGEVGETKEQCKEELAAIFANFVQETGANVGDLGIGGRNLNDLYNVHYINHAQLVGEELDRISSVKSVTSLIQRATALNLNYSVEGDLGVSPSSSTRLDSIKVIIPRWRQGLYAVAESSCRNIGGDFDENTCSTYRGSCADSYFGKVWQCPTNTKYYGRGAHQLTHNYNYGRFSSFLWGSKNRQKLVDNPNYIIDSEPWLAMLSATWFHMYSTGNKPSMHDIALKIWEPGSKDIESNRGQTFGTMINVINGGIECGKYTIQAQTRGQRYKSFRKYLGLSEVDDDFVRCDNQVPFHSVATNSGNARIYYEKGDLPGTCKLVKYERGFSVYDRDGSGYVECVKFHFGNKSDRPKSAEVQQGSTDAEDLSGELAFDAPQETVASDKKIKKLKDIDNEEYAKFAKDLFDIDIELPAYPPKMEKLTDMEYELYEAAILKHASNVGLNKARASLVKLKDTYKSENNLAMSDFSELKGSHSLLNLEVDSDKWPKNVKRVKRVLPEDKYNYFFPLRNTSVAGNGSPISKPTGLYTYKNFLNAAAFYPKFCDEAFDDKGDAISDEETLERVCKKSLSGMFAHFAQEVGAHDTDYEGTKVQGFDETIAQYRQGLFHVNEMGCDAGNPDSTVCPYRSCDPKLYSCAEDETIRYFGRGAKQISYNYNYIPFSQEIFGYSYGDILKNDPGMIARDGRLALLSAFFFYMTPQPPKPSMHEIDSGAWVPNAADIKAKRYRGFGASVMVINAECTAVAPDKAQAVNRFSFFKSFMKDFGIENDVDNKKDQTCVGMKLFDQSSSASYNSYWEQHWNFEGVCKLVPYQTKYSAFQVGTYKECVKDKFFR